VASGDKRLRSEELPHVGVPHIVFVSLADGPCDSDGNRVPAEFFGVLCVEVVLCVFTGTAVIFDDVLVRVADDNRKIAVLLDTPLGDGLDSLVAAVTVDAHDTVDCVGGERARVGQLLFPFVDRCHTDGYGSTALNGVGPSDARLTNWGSTAAGGRDWTFVDVCSRLPTSFAPEESNTEPLCAHAANLHTETRMSDWIAIGALAVVAVVIPLSMMFVSWLIRPSVPEQGKRATYESGEIPTGSSRRVKFNIQYYMVALLFVIFDIETAFIVPWTVIFDGAVGEAGFVRAFAPMAVFIGLLVVGLAWAWRNGAVEWVRSVRAERQRVE